MSIRIVDMTTTQEDPQRMDQHPEQKKEKDGGVYVRIPKDIHARLKEILATGNQSDKDEVITALDRVLARINLDKTIAQLQLLGYQVVAPQQG